MTIKEQLLLAIDTLPADQLPIALDFVESLSDRPNAQSENTAANLATFLRTPGNTWTGDDIRDCVETALTSRSSITFKHRINPFN